MYGYDQFTPEDLQALKRIGLLSNATDLLNTQLQGAYDRSAGNAQQSLNDYASGYGDYRTDLASWRQQLSDYDTAQRSHTRQILDNTIQQAKGPSQYNTNWQSGVGFQPFFYDQNAQSPDTGLPPAQINALWAQYPPSGSGRMTNDPLTKWWADFAADERDMMRNPYIGTWQNYPLPTSGPPSPGQYDAPDFTGELVSPDTTKYLDKALAQEARNVHQAQPLTPDWMGRAKSAKLQGEAVRGMVDEFNQDQYQRAADWQSSGSRYGQDYANWQAANNAVASAMSAYGNKWDAARDIAINNFGIVWDQDPESYLRPLDMYNPSSYNGIATWAASPGKPGAAYDTAIAQRHTPMVADIAALVGLPVGNAQDWYGYMPAKPNAPEAPDPSLYYQVPQYTPIATPNDDFVQKQRRLQEMSALLGG